MKNGSPTIFFFSTSRLLLTLFGGLLEQALECRIVPYQPFNCTGDHPDLIVLSVEAETFVLYEGALMICRTSFPDVPIIWLTRDQSVPQHLLTENDSISHVEVSSAPGISSSDSLRKLVGHIRTKLSARGA